MLNKPGYVSVCVNRAQNTDPGARLRRDRKSACTAEAAVYLPPNGGEEDTQGSPGETQEMIWESSQATRKRQKRGSPKASFGSPRVTPFHIYQSTRETFMSDRYTFRESREFSPEEVKFRRERLAAVRQQLLDDFADDPECEEIWLTAYDAALEEDKPIEAALLVDERYPTIEVPARELVELAKRVRATAPDRRYDIMVERASNGERWFDVLRTFSSEQLSNARQEIINQLSSGGFFPYGVEDALDLGVGTGKSLRVIEAVAQNVVGVDRNKQLLDVAKEVVGESTSLVRAEVDCLPFPKKSFDLVTSAGLIGALDKEMATGFYSELARLMRPGGFYLETSYYQNERGEFGDEMAAITASSKAMLADMIVDTVSGKLALNSSLSYSDFLNLCDALGLDVDRVVLEADKNNRSTVTILSKF